MPSAPHSGSGPSPESDPRSLQAPADLSPLWQLLKDTSRSFYLTLRVLPGEVRSQIGLAYLLARATDTVADTRVIPVEQRLAALEALRQRILGKRTTPLDLGRYATESADDPDSASAGERELMMRIEEAVALLARFAASDRALIHEVLITITSGQELDLLRFGTASSERVVALRTPEELDDYTYRVAGCVGEFWTKICSAHLVKRGGWDEAEQLRRGILFGKGLQLVNILRDLPKDLHQGRCYLPQSLLTSAGLSPADLLRSESAKALDPHYRGLLDLAEGHLRAGWDYTRSIPNHCRRVQWGCALPILIGIRTLAQLRQRNPLVATERIKVSRGFVRSAAFRTLLAVWGLRDWDRLPTWARG